MKKFILKNLDCANCAVKLESELNKSDTVKSASIDFGTLTMFIDSTDLEEDLKIINKIEPEVELEEIGKKNDENSHSNNHEHNSDKNTISKEKIKIGLAVLFLILGFVTKKNLMISNIMFIISYIAVGYNVIRKAIKNIFKGDPF